MALKKTMKLLGDGILKRSCGLVRMLSSSDKSCGPKRMLSPSDVRESSKIVESEVMDLQLPNLTFHDMCWSREDKWGGRAALVSGHLTLIFL